MFSNETSVEEIKPLLREKQYSENRCDWKLKIFSAFSDIKTSIPESKKLLNWILLYNSRASDWHVDGRNQTGSYAENQVWKLSQVSIKISFWNSGTIRILMQEK